METRVIEGVGAGALLLLVLLGCGAPPVPPTKAPAGEPRTLSLTGAGSALERVTTDPISETAPTLSPDGRSLLFYAQVQDATGSVKQRTLISVDPDTRAQRTLFTSTNAFSYDPAWLPDQSGYVYITNGPGTFSVVRALTAAPNAAITVIVGGEAAKRPATPAVSPNGKRVAFSTDVQGVQTIAVAEIDGSRLTLLGPGYVPDWSPDGTRLSFNRAVGKKQHIFTIDAQTGTGLVQVTNGEDSDYAARWSPDGKRLVFTSTRGRQKFEGVQGVQNLYVINKDGTELTQLTDGSATNLWPRWAADGWIYFSSNQAGNHDIWRLKPVASLAAAPSAPATPAAAGAAPPAGGAPAPATGGCTKDTDCKGDRICSKGVCVSP